MNWAIEKYVSLAINGGLVLALGRVESADEGFRNEFYNSKEGRMTAPDESDEATQGGTVRG